MTQSSPLIDTNLLTYQRETTISSEDFVDILQRSTLGERRPIQDLERIDKMLEHANLIVTARNSEGTIIGIARSLTDFTYCCYLSDLAVDEAYQHQGIGKQLIEEIKKRIGEKTSILLLAAPKAKNYYPHIGFRHIENAWALD